MPAGLDDEIEAQFRAMGAEVAAPRAEDFSVMRSNADSLDAWLGCDSQWRIAAGMGGLIWLGLDYAGVDVVLRRSRLKDPDTVFLDLQIMEGEALKVLSERG